MTFKAWRVVLVSLLLAPCAWPCGPFASYTFLTYGGRDILAMPQAMFSSECLPLMKLPAGSQDEGVLPEASELRALTDDTDIAEVKAALGEDGNAAMVRYEELRTALRNYSLNDIPAGGPFDLQPYEDLLQFLPAEFSEYMRGAVAYHDEAYEEAIAHFEAVLALPEPERQHRSTWTAFMLGKTWTELDPAQAAPHFNQVRALAAGGFPDSLELAKVSFGWQARAEMLAGRYLEAIHGYLQHARETGNAYVSYLSLSEVCARGLATEPIDPRLVDDSVARQVLTAYALSHEGAPRWLAALEAWAPEGEVPGADRLAWLAYGEGNMALAERWLKFARPEAPYAVWVRAKLALRAGNLADASALLAQAAEAFPKGVPSLIEDPMDEEYFFGPVPAQAVAREELGFVRTQLGQYPEALQAFLQGGAWADAACLAERVLNVDEVETFLQQHPNESMANERRLNETSDAGEMTPDQGLQPSLRFLLARRLARAGDWQRALQYYPEDATQYWWNPGAETRGYLPQHAKTLSDHLRAGKDEKLPARDRAQHLFEAAKILRADGMGLVATELTPDWAINGGSFPNTEIAVDRKGPDGVKVSEDFDARFAATGGDLPQQFLHYRQSAADLMWEAAELLPDNDVLTAHALYLGGWYIKWWYPKEADRFYKALVRRNPNLLIAQQADKLRWFPPEFTDEVLYEPLPRPWYGSKRRAMALIACGLVMAAALYAFIGWRQSIRKA